MQLIYFGPLWLNGTSIDLSCWRFSKGPPFLTNLLLSTHLHHPHTISNTKGSPKHFQYVARKKKKKKPQTPTTPTFTPPRAPPLPTFPHDLLFQLPPQQSIYTNETIFEESKHTRAWYGVCVPYNNTPLALHLPRRQISIEWNLWHCTKPSHYYTPTSPPTSSLATLFHQPAFNHKFLSSKAYKPTILFHTTQCIKLHYFKFTYYHARFS